MFSGKPIIGIAGGIGSGKSFVAQLFGELGCGVIDSDAQVSEAYGQESVRNTLRQWWGGSVLQPDGSLNRKEVARRVFSDPAERKRLEALVHPIVAALRDQKMAEMASNPAILAFVWDTPLLFEVGLNDGCDAVVFVEAGEDVRLSRVAQGRGWDRSELLRRENLQWPLDRKRKISDYIVQNTADADFVRRQVRDVLSRILTRASKKPEPS